MADEGFHLGNHPDAIDHRDFSHFSHEESQTLAPAALPTAPASTTAEPCILPGLPPIYEQLKIGSCTANAVAAALRFALKKTVGVKYEDYEPSRLWIYYQARILAKRAGFSDANQDVEDAGDLTWLIRKDTGCAIRSALKCLADAGVCQEVLWPYGTPHSDPDSDWFLDVDSSPNPCSPADMSAATVQAKLFCRDAVPDTSSAQHVTFSRIFDVAAKARVQSQADVSQAEWQMIYNQPAIALLEHCIQGGYPFVFSTQLFVGARLNSVELDANAVLVKPPEHDGVKRGRHTMLAVGFDPGRRLFLVQNSWGPKWPTTYVGTDEMLRGRFWMPYEWFEVVDDGVPVTYDFWVLKVT